MTEKQSVISWIDVAILQGTGSANAIVIMIFLPALWKSPDLLKRYEL